MNSLHQITAEEASALLTEDQEERIGETPLDYFASGPTEQDSDPSELFRELNKLNRSALCLSSSGT
jgi:hypothetical protein